jgi:hypothetical protein
MPLAVRGLTLPGCATRRRTRCARCSLPAAAAHVRRLSVQRVTQRLRKCIITADARGLRARPRSLSERSHVHIIRQAQRRWSVPATCMLA